MSRGIPVNRSLLVVGIAESVSGVGSWITQVAVFALVVFEGDGGALEASGIWLAGLGPTLLVSPLAGWLADRFDRKRLMIASELACGLAVVGLVLAPSLAVVYALLALQAVFGAAMAPARQAALPDLVAREDLSRANAFLHQLSGLVKITAPMLAGAILLILGPHEAMLLDVASYALSAAILTRLPAIPPGSSAARAVGTRTAHPRGEDSGESGRWRPWGPGLLEALGSSPRLRLVFAAQFLCVLAIAGFDVLYPIFVRDVLAGSAGLFGLTAALIGLGTVGVAAGLLLRREERDPWRDVAGALALLSGIPVSLTLATWTEDLMLARAVVAIGCLLGGAGNGLLAVQLATLLQLLTPRDLLGRVAGGYQSTTMAGRLVAICATPLLVPAVVSLGTYFGAASLALLLLALGIALSVRTSGASLASPFRLTFRVPGVGRQAPPPGLG